MAEDETKETAEPSSESKPAVVEPVATSSAAGARAAAAAPEQASSGHSVNGGSLVPAGAHGTHGSHGGHDDHGLAHTTPLSLLFGVLAALMVLTIVTVAVTAVDLGAQGNLVVAMVIATIKAALVVCFFMHLVWDKKLHLILFMTSVLFLILFLSLSVNDRGEYQPDIDAFQSSQIK